MRLLEHGPEGYVAYDTLCHRYEVAFHTTLLTYADSDLHVMVNSMSAQLRRCAGCVCPRRKLFYLRTHDEAIGMAISFAEMQGLVDMIEEALMTRAVQEVMEDLDRD